MKTEILGVSRQSFFQRQKLRWVSWTCGRKCCREGSAAVPAAGTSSPQVVPYSQKKKDKLRCRLFVYIFPSLTPPRLQWMGSMNNEKSHAAKSLLAFRYVLSCIFFPWCNWHWNFLSSEMTLDIPHVHRRKSCSIDEWCYWQYADSLRRDSLVFTDIVVLKGGVNQARTSTANGGSVDGLRRHTPRQDHLYLSLFTGLILSYREKIPFNDYLIGTNSATDVPDENSLLLICSKICYCFFIIYIEISSLRVFTMRNSTIHQ